MRYLLITNDEIGLSFPVFARFALLTVNVHDGPLKSPRGYATTVNSGGTLMDEIASFGIPSASIGVMP